MALKQDLNGYRTPLDVARRYKLGDIELTKEEIESIRDEIVCDEHLSITSKHPVQNKVVTENLNLKVTKEAGKGLSTNDFSDSYKSKVDSAYSKTQPVVVYESSVGSKQNITFTSSIENAEYVDIVYSDVINVANTYNTMRIYKPFNKTVSLSVNNCSTTGFEIRTQKNSINNYGITRSTNNKIAVDSTGTLTITLEANISDSDKLLIYKVISYM